MYSTVIALLVAEVSGHGFMTVPPARNVQSYGTANQYCPHCFNAGGTGAVSAASGGVFPWPETSETASRHGLCGDPAGSTDHMAGGALYIPDIVGTYTAGGKISIEILVTAHHNGHFEFSLCDKSDLADPSGPITQECLDQHTLLRSPEHEATDSHPIDPAYPGRYYLDPKCSKPIEYNDEFYIDAQKVTMTYDLPNVVSNFAVLQWWWVTANTCLAPGVRDYFNGPNAPTTFGDCGGDGGSIGWWASHLSDCTDGSYPEEFWNCANLKLVAGAPTPPTAPPAPTAAPPTTAATTAPPTSDVVGISSDKRLVAYVPNWKACPTAEQLSHYTHALVAFAVTYPAWKPAGQDTCGEDQSCTVQTVPGCGGKSLEQMVDFLHANDVEVILSFGGASMGGVWEAKGAAGSNSCWEHCLNKVPSLVSQLATVVTASGADGIDVDYEYFLDEQKYRSFLGDFTSGLRAALPSPLLLTHAPMDPDLCTTATHSGCRVEYLDIVRDHQTEIDFIMPQYYNGYMRPSADFPLTLSHFNALASYAFNGDASKVVFGFCIGDCPGFNVNANAALEVVQRLDEAVPSNGGTMFWESSADPGGAWSGGIDSHYNGGGSPTQPPATSPTQPPATYPTPGGGVVGACDGDPCPGAGQCRSEWGFCDVSAQHCNARSTWSPACDATEPPTAPPSTPTTTTGKEAFATRYWDCCKAHCSWEANVPSGVNPATSCNKAGESHGLDWLAPSACENPTDDAGYMCLDTTPFRVSDTLSYGFAAVPAEGEVCGKCFKLTFSGEGEWGPNHGASALAGKEMIVQATNIGYDVDQRQFDLQIPGGGVGLFDACTAQWGVSDPSILGAQYGGFLSGCQADLGWNAGHEEYKTCVRSKCDDIFGDGKFPSLHDGCMWFVDWYEVADNPKLNYVEVECPAELDSVSGMGATVSQPTAAPPTEGPPTAAPPTPMTPPPTPPTPPPTDATDPPSEPPTTAPPTAGNSCVHTVEHTVTNSWSSGYNVDLAVTAGPGGLAAGWSATWRLPDGETFGSGWNAAFEVRQENGGNVITATPSSWQSELAEGATANIGLQLTGISQAPPSSVDIGGIPCILGDDETAPPTVPPTAPPTEPPTPAPTPDPTAPPNTDASDATLIAQIIALLEALRDSSSNAQVVETAIALINELRTLQAAGATVPPTEMLQQMQSTLTNEEFAMNTEAKDVTTELLATIEKAESDGGVVGGGVDTAVVISACSVAVVAVVAAVAIVLRVKRKAAASGATATTEDAVATYANV